MIQSASEVLSGSSLETDILIIGAGAAGISAALGFVGTRTQVLVLEGGSVDYEARAQSLYKGRVVGLRYEPLDLCRVRGLGGSTGRKGWAGWCKPLRSIDFAYRPWVPLSGWPISYAELEPYYARAMRILSLPEGIDRQAQVSVSEHGVPFSGGDCENEVCPLSPATHLGEVWRDQLAASRNIHVLTNAIVTEVVANEQARHVTGATVRTPAGSTFNVTARFVVIAGGGIENARLLLLSDKVQREGLGNNSDFVGRCFMDHPRFAWGQIRNVADPSRLFRYDPTNAATHHRGGSKHADDGPLVATSITIGDAAQERAQILNARSWILPIGPEGERSGGRELREIALWLMRRRIPSDLGLRAQLVLADLPNAIAAAAAHLKSKAGKATHWQFVTTLEPEPNPDSRITLDDDVDALGLRQVKLDWRLGKLTERTLVETQRLIITDLKRAGFDCDIIGTGGEAANQSFNEPRWVWHHMGTTRMSADPRFGVVDADCRVHGIDNLFIAGSSVFPTVGNDMPTVTLIALACRLAEHLKEKLSPANVGPRRATAEVVATV
ncbi:MAG: GMC oxidoreductase [Hyphomicrobiaceae bacterium]